MLWTQILTFIMARRRDLAYRALVLTLLISVISAIHIAWPAVQAMLHNWALSLRGAFNLFIVYAVFILIFGSLFSPFLFQGSSRHRSGLPGRWAGRIAIRLSRIAVMGVINTFLYVVQIAYALISPQNAADRMVDASVHYFERMADLLFRPQR